MFHAEVVKLSDCVPGDWIMTHHEVFELVEDHAHSHEDGLRSFSTRHVASNLGAIIDAPNSERIIPPGWVAAGWTIQSNDRARWTRVWQ